LELKRKEWLSEVSLNKANMSKLLISMGVAMKEKEMEALIEAFDSNGDGVVTLSEFLVRIFPNQ
jgi:Ca2+-binding EF-hand superfamily protein